MQCIRVKFSPRTPGQFPHREDIRRLGLSIHVDRVERLLVWLEERAEINRRRGAVRVARDHHDARGVNRRSGREELWHEELGEEEGPDVVGGNLLLQPVAGELELPEGGRCVVDEHLISIHLQFTFERKG